MTNKILKLLKWTLVLLVGAPILIYLVWVIGNIRQDPLTPALVKLLALRPPQIAEKDNAYFDAIGLAAPDNEKPHRWGVTWFEQASAGDKISNAGGMPAIINLQRRTLPDTSKLPCSSKEAGHLCLKEIAADSTAARNALEKEALLLKRLDAILDSDYQEPFREMTFQSEIAPLAPISTTSRIALIRIALEINRGRDDIALARWGKETAYFLRQTKNSPSIIGKMVAIAILNRYQKLLAEYIALHPQAARARSKQILAYLQPFNKDALTMQPAFDNEAAVSARFMLSTQMNLSADTIIGEDAWGKAIALSLASPLWDRKATANEFTKMHMECGRVAALDGIGHVNGVTTLAALGEKPAELSTLLSFHNPVGKFILSNVGTVYCSPYIYKSDDILANKQLLNFAIKMTSLKANSIEVVSNEILANHSTLEHPSTGDLPVFDPKKRTLGYPVPKQFEITNYSPLEIRL